MPLLRMCGAMMRRARDVDGGRGTTRERLALDSLARAIMTRRMRHIYSHLGSGIRVRVNAAFVVLAAIAGRGKRCAAELFRTFDFSLAALPKLASPPRDTRAKEGAIVKRRKEPKDVMSGSTRRAFCEFVLAFFTVKDRALLRPVLAQRVLFGNVARFIAGDEAEMQLRVLRVIEDDVMSNEIGVPARLRAALFGDVSLEQLATIAGQSEDAHAGDGKAALAATSVLVKLLTDPAHGLIPEKSGVVSKKCATVVRLLQKLRPIECDAHLKILLSACETHPLLASMYLPGAKFTLDPRLSAHWLTSASVLGRISVAAGRDVASTEVAARLDGANTVGEAEGSAFIKAVIPPGMTKQTLSKGLAHTSPVIRHATLCLMLNVTRAIGSRLAHLNIAIAGGRVRASERVWKLEELASNARLATTTFLPEVQSIMAAYTASKGAKEGTKEWTAALLMRCHALNAISAQVRAVPEALVDAKVDFNKLLPSNDPTSLPSTELAAVIDVLCAARGLSESDEDDNVPSSSSFQDSGVNQGHLLSVFRVVIFATSVEARAAARRLAKHYLVTSGSLDDRSSEADVWIDKLTSFRANGFEHSRELLMSCTEFLAEATTAATRRRFKHDSDVQRVLQDSNNARPTRFSINDLTESHLSAATLAVSSLAMTACESVGKVLKSEKRSREFKLAVSAYVSSVMICLVQTSYDPWAVAVCAQHALGDQGEGYYPAMDSLQAFTRRCLEESVQDSQSARRNQTSRHGTSPLEWSCEALSQALDDLYALSPEDRGLALFSMHAHGPMLAPFGADVAAMAIFGSSDELDENTALLLSLVKSLDATAVVTACSSVSGPLLGADMSEAAPASELCARVITMCPKRDLIRVTRSLVFWCKWNHARGDVRTVTRLIELCRVALNRARYESENMLSAVRLSLFSTTSLYAILDESTDRSLADLVVYDAYMNSSDREMYLPYIQRSVDRLHAALHEPNVETSVNVALIALATNDEKLDLLEKFELLGATLLGIQVADVASFAGPSARVRMQAVRYLVRSALSSRLDATGVTQACRVAQRALDALPSDEMLMEQAPDLAVAPEASELVRLVLKESDVEARVQLAAAFLAQSDALALQFIVGAAARISNGEDILRLLPLARGAMRWDALYRMSEHSKAVADVYRDFLMDEFLSKDVLPPSVKEHGVETLVSCMKISPLEFDSEQRDRFIERVMPSTGWAILRHPDHIVRARVSMGLFAKSESITEQIMFLTSTLQTLALFTQTTNMNASMSRDVSSEKFLAECLASVLDGLFERDVTTVPMNKRLIGELIKASQAFMKQSIAHKFRAHRRLAIMGQLCTVLLGFQTTEFEMQAAAESILSQIISHPMFERTLTAVIGGGDSELPVNLREMSVTMKSIVEAVRESSAHEERSEPNNASALKLELLRVMRLLWKLQDADGKNGKNKCMKWRARNARVIVSLASGYGATLSEADCLTQELMLDIDASTGGGVLRSIGYLWGESVTHFVKTTISVRRNEDTGYDVDDLLYSHPSPALVASAIREGSPPDARRAAATAARFPMSRTTPPSNVSVNSSHVDEIVPFGYDPSWMLPFTMHALMSGAMDPREAVAWGLAPLAAAALASHDESTRRIAYTIFSVMNDRISDPLYSFRERTQVLACLSAMRNATTSSLMRWPSPGATLAAECMLSSLYPETDTFLPLQKQLNRRAALDLSGLPMFLPMLNSGDVDARQHRLWILRLLRASLKDETDATIFRKTFALEVVMSHYSATLAESYARFLMLDLVARACAVLPAARPLVEGGGLIAWMASITRAACVNDKYNIRSGETPALRASTAKVATEALVTLIRHKGSIYLGPTGTAADYLSALQTIRASILRDGDDAANSGAELAGRRAALGPYLKLHHELATRLRRRIAEVGDPVEISRLCRVVDAAPNSSALRDDMFKVIVSSEGGGRYAKRCTRETFRALADAVTFSASWAAAHATDVSLRVSVQAGEDAFEKTARWCANALANGGNTLANALLSSPECGGASRFAAIMCSCEHRASDDARRALRLPSIAAHLCLLRAVEIFDDDTALSDADAAIKRTINVVDRAALAPGGSLDRAVAASASGDSRAGTLARAFLRAIFAGVEPSGFDALEKITETGERASKRTRA